MAKMAWESAKQDMESKQWMLFKLSDLKNMDLEELKIHEHNIWNYWETIRKVVKYRELVDVLDE